MYPYWTIYPAGWNFRAACASSEQGNGAGATGICGVANESSNAEGCTSGQSVEVRQLVQIFQGIAAQVDAVVVAAVHQEQEGDVPLRKFNSWHWRGKNI